MVCLASDGSLSFSPLLGVVIGAVCTLIIIVLLVALRLRRGAGLRFSFGNRKTTTQSALPHQQHHQRLVATAGNGGSASVKPLLRSVSPRENVDEQDPDVIPAKFGKISIRCDFIFGLL